MYDNFIERNGELILELPLDEEVLSRVRKIKNIDLVTAVSRFDETMWIYFKSLDKDKVLKAMKKVTL